MIPARTARAAAAAAVVLAALLLGAAPGAAAALPPPDPSGRAAIVVDAGSGEVLYERRPDERRPIASATKLMTALLTLERARPQQVFRAGAYRASAIESKIGLRPGERMRVGDLLVALMLESANDAAVTLAENISGSEAAFVGDMNRRARELGLRGTSFSNPIGLDEPGNHSTARDLATLARRLLGNPRFGRIVDRSHAVLRSGARPRVVNSRNRLLRRAPFVDGVKTGHTREAGYVLIGSGSGRGVRVVSVTLGAPSEAARDADTLALLRYGIDRFRRVQAVAAGRILARRPVAHFDRRVGLTARRPVAVTVRRGRRVGTRVRAPEELEGPLAAGSRVGAVEVLVDGRVVRRASLVTAARVPEAGILRRLGGGAGVTLTSLAALAIVVAVILLSRRRRAPRMRGAGTTVAEP